MPACPGEPAPYRPHVALTIAGSDSGGGAGVAADLRTFAALQVHGTLAITAVTAQNTAEVRHVWPMSAETVTMQVEAVLDDIPVSGVKTGLLPNAEVVEAVARLARLGRLPNLVVDPVMVASTGRPLVGKSAVDAYRDSLIPYATLLTPNLDEARVLLRLDPSRYPSAISAPDALCHVAPSALVKRPVDAEHMDVADLIDMAMDLARQLARGPNPPAILLKGGHCPLPVTEQRTASGPLPPDARYTLDVLVIPGQPPKQITSPYIATSNTHGSGCSLSSAIAANLAKGASLDDAARRAAAFVNVAIAAGSRWELGAGHGPLDHFQWATTAP